MKKKILALLIAFVMLLGQGLSAVSIAAPRDHHNNRPAHHSWFNFWHRDRDKKPVKHKKQPPKKHKIKKKDSNHRWFKWHKDKPAVKKKHQEKKKIKLFEKKKKHEIKKHHKSQKVKKHRQKNHKKNKFFHKFRKRR